jgi:hypothetical protein
LNDDGVSDKPFITDDITPRYASPRLDHLEDLVPKIERLVIDELIRPLPGFNGELFPGRRPRARVYTYLKAEIAVSSFQVGFKWFSFPWHIISPIPPASAAFAETSRGFRDLSAGGDGVTADVILFEKFQIYPFYGA